ncbi:hypothetical protein [Coraliomargarita akajimensis]|nr:hypothetical protein [Coraliomargarita akajimensis]
MKINIEDIPVFMEGPATVLRRQTKLGKMDATYCALPKGTDFSPLLEGLCDDCCDCPHWGYLISGMFRIIYTDGTEDILESGDVFYLPGGHTAIVEEDVKAVMFSPDEQHGVVLDHALRRAQELAG